jgi:hypothetical protein
MGWSERPATMTPPPLGPGSPFRLYLPPRPDATVVGAIGQEYEGEKNQRKVKKTFRDKVD